MKGRALVLVSGALIWACGCNRGDSRAAPGIPLPEVADYIHTVIAADRAIYAEQVVHRLQDVEKVIKADEKFKAEKALPLPAQMLRMGTKRWGERNSSWRSMRTRRFRRRASAATTATQRARVRTSSWGR